MDVSRPKQPQLTDKKRDGAAQRHGDHIRTSSNSREAIDHHTNTRNRTRTLSKTVARERVSVDRFWYVLLCAVMLTERACGRTVRTKYGDVSGVIVTPDNRYLDAVEVFKGVPYASPPVGSLRFMPPVTGAKWSGVKMANRFSAVCPQLLPEVSNETAALKRMPRGRLEHLKRVLPSLRNQSEDCLYLNIYAPAHADLRDSPTLFPVLVYIHGDSYMWGAGSLYDGTVLSSYGGLIVVTVNYRLGVLGFLNSNLEPNQRAPSNFGLMDQIAALHWIQENVIFFGGDPRNVTLMGHGTGAACVHFLITSTAVPEGVLFHRAILMSGSALCPWALVRDPGRYAKQVARHVDCPLDLHLLQCLRDRPLDLLMSAAISPPEFLYAFGPSLDGVIIGGRNLVDDVDDLYSVPLGNSPIRFHNFLNPTGVGLRKNMMLKMSRYDLMVGMVKLESYFSFAADDVQYGIEADRKLKIMRTFVRNTFRYHLSEILATVVNEYTDWERPVQHPINIRDETMDALSDATVVAPLIQTADLHSAASYMYVFDYQTRLAEYPQKQGCVHGEELAYVFGAPLVGSMTHFPRNYTKTETQLSETTMDYWTNFIKTGNPNQGTDSDLPLGMMINRQKTKNIDWQSYDKTHKRYFNLDMKPKMKNHYRAHRLSFWLNLVPTLHRPGSDDVPRSHHQLDPFDHDHNHEITGDADDSFNSIIHEPSEKKKPAPVPKNSSNEYLPPIVVVASSSSKGSQKRHDDLFSSYPTALGATILVGCSLLLLNILIVCLVCHQRNKGRKRSRRHHGSSASVASDHSARKLENGGPMSTICVTSGATELSTVETRLTLTPSTPKDLRLLILQAPPADTSCPEFPTTPDLPPPPDIPPLDFLPLQDRPELDIPPPLPPKTSKLSVMVAGDGRGSPLYSHYEQGSETLSTNEDSLRV